MKILIVEDDPASRIYLSDTVKSLGHECHCAEDGKAGLESFQKVSPDLIISDIRMPHLDGLQMLAKIRRQDSNVIVVMTTGFGSEEYALEALRNRANDYLPKPVRHEVLIPLIKKYSEILKNRTVDREIIGMVVRRSCVLRFDNRLALVPRIVDRLMQEAAPAIPSNSRLGVHLGLVELLANAIEHGNLGTCVSGCLSLTNMVR